MKSDIRSKTGIIKKILKIVGKILYNLFTIICVLLIAIIVLQKITDNNRSVGGYRIFRVITGSMLPEYDVGEVVIAKQISPYDIEVGDDIVYRGTYGDYNGKIIMHKVIQIDIDENKNLNFHAQGLHNSSVEDPQIKPNQIYGVVKLKSKILSVLYKLATSIYSAFIIITVLVVNVFLSFKVSGKQKIQQLAEFNEEISEDEIYEAQDDVKEATETEVEIGENDDIDDKNNESEDNE